MDADFEAVSAIFDEFGINIATIYVGQEHEEFRVHEKLLIKSSEYFKKALGGGFKEAENKEVSLPQDDADSFALYAYWLYRREFPKFPKEMNMAQQERILKAWFSVLLLSNKLLLPKSFVDEANKGLNQAWQSISRTQMIRGEVIVDLVYRTEKGEGLRTWLLYHTAHDLATSQMDHISAKKWLCSFVGEFDPEETSHFIWTAMTKKLFPKEKIAKLDATNTGYVP